ASPASSSSTDTPAATPASTPTPAPATPVKTPKAAKTQPSPTVTFTTQPPNAALIRTNGNRQIVALGDHFPTASPLFTLVSVTKKGARIGVLDGSFASGVPTMLLKKGQKLTLANQADGTHYVLQLVRLTNATPQPTPATGTPTATTTTTTTTTTPLPPAAATTTTPTTAPPAPVTTTTPQTTT